MSIPSCIRQSMQCHILVTCSTRPQGQGWKQLQKPHFRTFGENLRQQSSQKKSSMSGSSQPFPVVPHSVHFPLTEPTFCVANSSSEKLSRSLSMRDESTCPTVGFSQVSRITCRCNDGRLTFPCFRRSCSMWLTISATCAPVIQSLPIFSGCAASRMAPCSRSHRASKSPRPSHGRVKNWRRSCGYASLMRPRSSRPSVSCSDARIASSALSL
mmetsp:Transcript_11790/g.32278  ORF Transcript_11790/g.32278 Transcript_11790/m.32278 type:complete len:213 (-) Transcript_11790:509-1147(-)